MGKNNRARRAAKAKTRQRSAAHRARGHSTDHQFGRPPADGFGFSDAEVLTLLWVTAARGRRLGTLDETAWRRLLALPRSRSLLAAETLVLEHVDLLYANGWQPVELLRQGRLNGLGAACRRLLAHAIACDHAIRRAATLDPMWMAQVASMDLPAESGAPGWLDRCLADVGQLEHQDAVDSVLDTYAALLRLPPLQRLMPSPGPPGGGPCPLPFAVRRGAVADPVLTRVRNLLSKAESSTFEAEATAYTAKAQELITRHAIDVALVEEDTPTGAVPVEARIPIDTPYADAKSLLLQTVAETGRCKAVFMPHLQMSTVVGFADDVETVELLFTSLLVQVQHAMSTAAKSAPPGARTRGASYRSSFLVSYTHRIGDRLRQINLHAVEDATLDTGRNVLPVLADRSSRVADYVADRFGDLQEGAVRGGYDGAGWAGGRIAADSAQLSFGELSDGFDAEEFTGTRSVS